MNGTERREQILSILKNSEKPVPGVELARILHVSRQVIVQDMALLPCQWSGNPLYEPRICDSRGAQLQPRI